LSSLVIRVAFQRKSESVDPEHPVQYESFHSQDCLFGEGLSCPVVRAQQSPLHSTFLATDNHRYRRSLGVEARCCQRVGVDECEQGFPSVFVLQRLCGRWQCDALSVHIPMAGESTTTRTPLKPSVVETKEMAFGLPNVHHALDSDEQSLCRPEFASVDIQEHGRCT